MLNNLNKDNIIYLIKYQFPHKYFILNHTWLQCIPPTTREGF